MTRRSNGRTTLTLVTIIALTWPAFAQRTEKRAETPAAARIEIQARPIEAFDHREPGRKRFGLLEYRGGLVLTSSFREFGGVSGISVASDGADFLAVTDRSWWLRGRITYSGTRPTGIAAAEMAPMLGPDGRTLASRRWYDSEALVRDGDTAYVAIERVHRIVRFDLDKDPFKARARPIEVPAAFRSLPRNGGIEALALLPAGSALAGTLVAIAERGRDEAGDHRGFLLQAPRSGTFTVKRKDAYDVSDVALVSANDLLLLERKFGWTTGLFIRIRRLAVADIRPGALVDGPVVFEADLGQQIDNMEGISAHRVGGETVLTLISDDNFSPIQRTLLLQFTLVQP